jgi:tRNA/rRNA methyltransferase
MANFGFKNLTVVSPYQPHWREARSAVGAPELLAGARETSSLADAVKDCTLVLGTGTLNQRKAEQPVVSLVELTSILIAELQRDGKIAIVFGPEKHGLTRDDLSWCHVLVEIPTDSRQPSMNLGQAAAVCLYELATRAADNPLSSANPIPTNDPAKAVTLPSATSGNLELLAGLIEEVMICAKYSPNSMQDANRHDLRLMLRRLHLNAADTRRALGLFRRILWRFRRHQS